MAQQLEFFDLDPVDELRLAIKEMKESHTKTRRALFAKLGELTETCLKLKYENEVLIQALLKFREADGE